MSTKTCEKIFHPTAEKLKYLLASVHAREMALPDFQRDFVWDPSATEELIESICQNFPAGSLLRIKNSDNAFFAPREIAGAPSLNETKPSYLILDGQQRMTSLYQAFYGVGSHRYFIEIGDMIKGGDLEDCVWHERKREADKWYSTLEQQAENFIFPFSRLFGEDEGFEEWMDAVLEIRPEEGDERKDLKRKIREVKAQFIQSVLDYEFPMVTLAEETSPVAVCTIFETLNRTGVKLSVFDLLAARFWPEDVRLRDLWLKALNDYPIIEEFWTDPYYVLQAISLFTAKTAPSCKRGDVLKMEVSQIRDGWDEIIKGFAEGYQMLRDDCGIVLPQWMPYVTLAVPLAAICANAGGITGPAVGANRDKIKRWFWCAVFAQSYDSAQNSKAARDFGDMTKWSAGGAPPQVVEDFTFDPDILRQVTPRQRAIYRGCIGLILRNQARDFHTGKRITVNLIQEEKIDDHHVFPQGYIADNLEGVSNTLRDSILNRTLIDKLTNIRIGKRAPSDYLKEIRSEQGDKFQQLIESHLLPSDALLADNHEDFINQRQALLWEKIQEVTS
jgi:hypothetical protein